MKNNSSTSSRPVKKVRTADGAATLYSERYRQHYHNVAGAHSESRHVFFEQTGLAEALKQKEAVSIFETGFGTGSHLLLLEWYRLQLHSKAAVHYSAVEKEPLCGPVIREINFPEFYPELGHAAERLARLADRLCQTDAGVTLTAFPPLQPDNPGVLTSHTSKTEKTEDPQSTIISPAQNAVVEIYHGDFCQWDLSNDPRQIHFFFHDAFSPEVNPELWTPEIFHKLRSIAHPQAMLGTYCSATKARAAMVLGGWHVARCSGPPGKREMTLASPSENRLSGFRRVNEQRLRKRFSGD